MPTSIARSKRFTALLEIYRKALNDGVEKYLVGRPVKPVMRKHC